MAGLAGERLPSRAIGVARIGDHSPAGRPDRRERVVWIPSDLGDRLLTAADLEPPVEDPREQRVGRAERVAKDERMHPSPAPRVRIVVEARLQVVERSTQRVERQLVPRAPGE